MTKLRIKPGFRYVAQRNMGTSWVENGDKYSSYGAKYKDIVRILVLKNNKCVNFITFNAQSGKIMNNYKY